MDKFKKTIIITFIAASALISFAGCSGDSETSMNLISNSNSDSSANQGTKTPEETLPAGNDIEGAIGEKVNYDNKLNITLDRVYNVSNDADQNSSFGFVFTIENLSSDALTVSAVGNFDYYVDGTLINRAYANTTSAMRAIRALNPLTPFTDPIQAGASAQGIAFASLSPSASEYKVQYKPYPSVSNDTVTITFKPSDISVPDNQ